MAADKPHIPEEMEELLKVFDGQLFGLYVLLARTLQRLEKYDGRTPESLIQELELIRQSAPAPPGWKDNWRVSSFDIGVDHALVRLRGMLDDLPPLD